MYRESRGVISLADRWALAADGMQSIAGGARYRESQAVISLADRWVLLADRVRSIAGGARYRESRAVISRARRPMGAANQRSAIECESSKGSISAYRESLGSISAGPMHRKCWTGIPTVPRSVLPRHNGEMTQGDYHLKLV